MSVVTWEGPAILKVCFTQFGGGGSSAFVPYVIFERSLPHFTPRWSVPSTIAFCQLHPRKIMEMVLHQI